MKMKKIFKIYKIFDENQCCANQWRTLHEILGGGASARGLVRLICPCHGRGVRGHAPTGKF